MDDIHKLVVALLFVSGIYVSSRAIGLRFEENYQVTWGFDHVRLRKHGERVQLYMDIHSGAGFESRSSYGSGFFQMRIKVPNKDSGGVVTAYYLTSSGDNHDELDFEFLGNREGRPYQLQTNVFANGIGNREHRVHLWFDPRDDFHTYKILWNVYHIVFFVDNIPIRIFNNNIRIGVDYPSKPMKITASIWDGSAWATDGGLTKVNWTHAPFRAHFEDFNINGCSINQRGQSHEPCNSDKYWWNTERYRRLNPTEQKAYKIVKDHFVTYDYCNDRNYHPIVPPECFDQ